MLLSVARRRILAVAAGCFTFIGGSAAHAGISYIDPQASASAYAFNDQDSDAATGAGPLNVNAQASRSADGLTGSAKASGEYVLDQASFRGTTVVAGSAATEPGAPLDSSNQSSADTFLKLSFTIDQAYRATFSSNTIVGIDENTRESDQIVGLMNDAPGAFPIINSIMLGDPNGVYLLEPGTYNFQYTSNLLTSPYSADSEFTRSFSFDFVPVSDGGENPAVPLPPAAWMGLITLGGMAAVQLRQRRAIRRA